MDFSFLYNLSCDALKIISIGLAFAVAFLVKKVFLNKEFEENLQQQLKTSKNEIKDEIQDTKEVMYSKIETVLNKIEERLNTIQKEIDELDQKLKEIDNKVMQTAISLEEGEKVVQNMANEIQRMSLSIENYKSQVIQEIKNELKEFGFFMRMKNV